MGSNNARTVRRRWNDGNWIGATGMMLRAGIMPDLFIAGLGELIQYTD